MKERLIAFNGGGNSDRILKRTVKSSVLRLPTASFKMKIWRGEQHARVCVCVWVCVCVCGESEQT